MWKFTSNVISNIRLKKNSAEPSRACSECSDDENSSNLSREEGLECPICCESFNIVENVPYVLCCGHTLCKNCVLSLQVAVLNFASRQIKIPFLISCPWCHLLSFRLVSGGNLRFPRKNFFLLWMVESLNGEREKFVSSGQDSHPISSPRNNLALRCMGSPRRLPAPRNSGQLQPGIECIPRSVDARQASLTKSIDMFISFMSKFPLVIVFLLILFFVVPGCALILVLYLLLTVLFAVPSFLVLYFAYPVLGWLVKEITS
ncbi:hypothetical protein SAY87_001659 [Trapa incisa]|uniref:RING-type domain-containing protein n=2 Tax=Trapa TaxID=22665 RepID=A0AAN7KHF9_TRANT|nr:hypothetical protein SAY87_001659 [Trapa incisa]KAK4764693.1 hypothetical protein SAY86_025783 [Trapa natans]